MFTSPLIALLTALPAVLSCAVPRSPDLSSISSIQPRPSPTFPKAFLRDAASQTSPGIQNYTCTSGAYVSTGALANLFDVTCLYSMTAGKVDTNELSTVLPKMAFSALQYPDTLNLPVAIHHLFVDTPGSNTTGAISPLFVGSTDQVLVSKTATSNDLTDPSVNVPWLQLTAVEGQGTLAKSVYRLDTVNGQAPSTCDTEGEDLSVQYAALYWFTN
ncbi:hypothetical protein L202_08277 [Cryptococcus amylolentus CBS 6039]|uniref:Malate dehydrogenase n=1 Tax=Cryptococcus amylolentus CBS 6039 TaxID=1295533 RepID=A0A1E3H933_9TREE|nr:hypothetical protein L202_08277 [Cryptococcus amylolentus CBS 6039]ODN72848.1 hypothetical protein L202_08277 [Cryptococcus amylolentus CBS 6039]